MTSPTFLGEMKATNITLNDTEATLKRLLLDVARYIDSSSQASGPQTSVVIQDTLARSPTILRFTGGWVRDKLLGVDSHDIDVAINKMTGYQFGKRMLEYLAITGNASKYGIRDQFEVSVRDSDVPLGTTSTIAEQGVEKKLMGGLHKIEANPEKSKHLETVTTRILGLDVDMVNLRTEQYSDDSRHPQMALGTPEEDAFRRDATINAMFYNLNTSSVEDFTSRGLRDMRSKLIRTPLEPGRTFKDDPLRMLRLIRFASRLGYSIDRETELAMDNDAIRAAFQVKISRERVGIEMEKMLRVSTAHKSLVLIHRLNLYSVIFPAPGEIEQLAPNLANWSDAYNFTEGLVSASIQPPGQNTTSNVDSIACIAAGLLPPSHDPYILWLLVAAFPWRGASLPKPAKPGSKQRPPLPAEVAREGLKITNKAFEAITTAYRHEHEVRSLIPDISTPKSDGELHQPGTIGMTRDTVGIALRRWGPNWRYPVLVALLSDLFQSTSDKFSPEYRSICERYAAFLEYVRQADLFEAYALKPPLDGKQLMSALNASAGPWVKEAMDIVMAWQLRNPGNTETDGAIKEVEQQSERLKIKRRNA